MEDFFDMTNGLSDLTDNYQNQPIEGVDDFDNMLSYGSSNPFDSGFDAEHPFPTYEQLRNAGFSDYLADRIVNGDSHSYSQRELFQCFYESDDDPLTAYNNMMHVKMEKSLAESDELINKIESSGIV